MSFVWTPENFKYAAERFAIGISAGVLAKELGTTRSAVAGKMAREGIKGNQHAPTAESLPWRRPVERKGGVKLLPIPEPMPEPVLAPAPAAGKPFMELGPRDCRYTIGRDERGHIFCAAEAPAGQSYCAACRAIVYIPAESRKRKPSQDAPDMRRGVSGRIWA